MILGFGCSLISNVTAAETKNAGTQTKKKKKISMKESKKMLESLTSKQRKALKIYLSCAINKAVNLLNPNSQKNKKNSSSNNTQN